MNAIAVASGAPGRPILGRFFTSWPVVCTAVSAVFLGTVYLLGNFRINPAPDQLLAPTAPLTEDIRQIVSTPSSRDNPLLAVAAHNPVAIAVGSQLATPDSQLRTLNSQLRSLPTLDSQLR